MDMLDKRMIHVLVGWTGRAVRFHHATQNELFIPCISHLIFLTKTVESEIVAVGGGAVVIPAIEFLWSAKAVRLTTTQQALVVS